MKQFLVCWFRDSSSLWVCTPYGEWRFRNHKGIWMKSIYNNWKTEEFDNYLKVNNFKEK